MVECPYAWAECPFCQVYGDYRYPDSLVKSAVYECTWDDSEPTDSDFCPRINPK